MIERPSLVVPYMIDFFEKLQRKLLQYPQLRHEIILINFFSAKKVVIFGPPASGKRTFGEFLSRRLGLEFVSARDIVDGVKFTESAIGKELRNCSEQGIDPPPDLVEALITCRLQEKDCNEKVRSSQTHSYFLTL